MDPIIKPSMVTVALDPSCAATMDADKQQGPTKESKRHV